MKFILSLFVCAVVLAGCAVSAPVNEPTNIPTVTPTVSTPAPTQTTEVYAPSEEELAEEIAQAVEQAVYLAETTSQYTIAQSSDGSLSSEEADQAALLLAEAAAALEDVLSLMEEFTSLYGENADEIIATLSQMEDELEAISASLDQIAAILEQGSASLEQLDQALAEIESRAANVMDLTGQWRNMLPVILAMNEEYALNTLPDLEAANRVQALEFLRNFVQELRGALVDRKINPPEMESISRWGANARAALVKFNLDGTADLDARIQILTSFAARGQWSQITPVLEAFELSLPGR